jgi:hypothetical protein
MLSVSSKRHARGLSNSFLALGSKGCLDHKLKPAALHGTAPFTACLTSSGANGNRLPIQISSANTAAVANIFMPEITTPSSSSRTTCRLGIGRFCFW